MRLITKSICALLFATLSLVAVSNLARAQSADSSAAWPSRPVRFIVPFGPGGGADIGGRLFADKLSQIWGQPVVIDNRPGGDSMIAIQAFLGANDDHTFLFSPSGNFAVHPFVHSKLPYDPSAFVPIVRASNTVIALAVSAQSPYKTLKEFTEAARAADGKFNSGLVTGITEFTFWGYANEQKLKITQVPYRDINQAPTDLGEGRIQVVMTALAIAQPQWQAGRIRLIAVNNGTRVAAAPDVPTAKEAGYPSLELEGLVGLFGLKNTPEAIKSKIVAGFKAAAADGSIAERLKATGQVINIGDSKEFTAAIDGQRATIAATAKAIDFKPKQ